MIANGCTCPSGRVNFNVWRSGAATPSLTICKKSCRAYGQGSALCRTPSSSRTRSSSDPGGSGTMLRALVDFSLGNRLLVLAIAVLLFIWGVISFRSLPVEAYPDVANNYVQVITQWPGISAEQVEQQVTIPLEIVMNGIPHLEHLRSTSLFGLSSVMLIFDDDSDNDSNRVKIVERLSRVTLPAGVQAQMGADWSPVGQIYFFTLHSTNPAYDVMDLKSSRTGPLKSSSSRCPTSSAWRASAVRRANIKCVSIRTS